MPKCVVCGKVIKTLNTVEMMQLAWHDGWHYHSNGKRGDEIEIEKVTIGDERYVSGICPECGDKQKEKIIREEIVNEAVRIVEQQMNFHRAVGSGSPSAMSAYAVTTLLYVQTEIEKLAGEAAVKQEEQKPEKIKTRFDYIADAIRGDV